MSRFQSCLASLYTLGWHPHWGIHRYPLFPGQASSDVKLGSILPQCVHHIALANAEPHLPFAHSPSPEGSFQNSVQNPFGAPLHFPYFCLKRCPNPAHMEGGKLITLESLVHNRASLPAATTVPVDSDTIFALVDGHSFCHRSNSALQSQRH